MTFWPIFHVLLFFYEYFHFPGLSVFFSLRGSPERGLEAGLGFVWGADRSRYQVVVDGAVGGPPRAQTSVRPPPPHLKHGQRHACIHCIYIVMTDFYLGY